MTSLLVELGIACIVDTANGLGENGVVQLSWDVIAKFLATEPAPRAAAATISTHGSKRKAS
jgi:hypothetical protein|eukprot:scaffold2874_cov110-Alexandrium_tamarense.AAC.20